jgi:hypothetical protein
LFFVGDTFEQAGITSGKLMAHKMPEFVGV